MFTSNGLIEIYKVGAYLIKIIPIIRIGTIKIKQQAVIVRILPMSVLLLLLHW